MDKLVFIKDFSLKSEPYTTSKTVAEYAGLLSYINYPLKKHFAETVGYRLARDKQNPLNMEYISLDIETTEDGTTLSEVIPDDNTEQVFENAEDEIFSVQLHNKLDEVMAKALNEKQKNIIEQRFYDGLTLKEVGERNSLTRERIRQIENASLRQLRKPQYTRELKPFVSWCSCSILYHGSLSGFKHTHVSTTERIIEKIDEWQRAHQKQASYGVKIAIKHDLESTEQRSPAPNNESYGDYMKRIDKRAELNRMMWI